MADQENCMRVTRLAAKKRAAEEALQPPENKKKRVVLGEIQNIVSSERLDLDKNQKLHIGKPNVESKPKRKVKKGKAIESKSVNEEKGYEAKCDDDPQMCGAYASDIYEYLHNMEVRFI